MLVSLERTRHVNKITETSHFLFHLVCVSLDKIDQTVDKF